MLILKSYFNWFISGVVIGGGRIPNKFSELKKEKIQPGYSANKKLINKNVEETNAPKRNHALRYLQYLGEFYADSGYGETVADVKFIPYDRLKEVYQEYKAKTEREDSDIFPVERLLAGRELFRQCYVSLKNTIRLRTCKGAFETCSVCNAFHEILKSESLEWSMDKVQMVQKFKRLHLQLQAEERANAEKRKTEARDSYDSDGIKFSILLIIDH